MDLEDKNPLITAKREAMEETGLDNLNEIQTTNDPLVPIDIDTHFIKVNTRLNLPRHYHFDFRYLFSIDKIKDIKIDEQESSCFKWLSLEELYTETNYGRILDKIKDLLFRE